MGSPTPARRQLHKPSTGSSLPVPFLRQGACLQLSADFDYTSSVKGFRNVDLFAFWSLFGENWGPVISSVLIQEEFRYL